MEVILNLQAASREAVGGGGLKISSIFDSDENLNHVHKRPSKIAFQNFNNYYYTKGTKKEAEGPLKIQILVK